MIFAIRSPPFLSLPVSVFKSLYLSGAKKTCYGYQSSSFHVHKRHEYKALRII